MSVNPLDFLGKLLNAVENPEDIVLIEAFGHLINTVAAHNKNHLGAAASSTLQTIGTDIQMAPAVAQSFGGLLGAQTTGYVSTGNAASPASQPSA